MVYSDKSNSSFLNTEYDYALSIGTFLALAYNATYLSFNVYLEYLFLTLPISSSKYSILPRHSDT